MSPTEGKGRALGLELVQFDRHEVTTVTPAGSVKTRFFAKFDAPRLKADARSGTRRTMKCLAKSRAGAWRIAVRWLRQLQAGKL